MSPEPRPCVHVVFPRREGRRVEHSTFARWGALPQRTLGLFVLAALARRAGWRVEVCDENWVELPTSRPDLVLLSVWTSNAPSAYELSAQYRAQGVPVVMGGVHPSMMPFESLRHADAVVVGEAEGVLDRVLRDVEAGTLEQIYDGGWHAMSETPHLAEYLDLYRAPAYRRTPILTMQTARGCRFNCSFCSVIRINGRGVRHMEPERVVEELRMLRSVGSRVPGGPVCYVVDDDMASDRDASAAKFEAIVRAGLRTPMAIQASIGMSRDHELMDLAQRAGCISVFVGLESVERDSLIEANKKNRPTEYREAVDRFHAHRMGVAAGIIFGFDHDGPDIFARTVDVLDGLGVDSARFGALTPMPGTAVFAEMHGAGRIVSYDWSQYDGLRAVIEPARMSPATLTSGVLEASRRWARLPSRARRVGRQLSTLDWRLGAGSLVASRRYEARAAQPEVGPAFTPLAEDLDRLAQVSAAPASLATTVAVQLSAPSPK